MSEQTTLENISMFDDLNDNIIEEANQISINPNNTAIKLEVLKFKFIEFQNHSWEELFEGFEKLYAITYSSSVDFICKLLKKFEQAEIIFGLESVMSNELHDIFAYQSTTLSWLKEKSSANKIDLISRIDNNTLRMFVARNFLSHEKISLLESNNGRKRTILGSANLSNSAYSGRQRENTLYTDDDEAFDRYRVIFEYLKENSTDNIISKMLMFDETYENFEIENIKELPISRTANLRNGLLLEPQNNISDEIKFVMETKKRAERLKPFMPKKEKDGKIRILPDSIKQINKRLIDNKKREKELKVESPQLNIDYDNKTADLNGYILDLNPNREEISRDVNLFLEYMGGFKDFHGDWVSMQFSYFRFANWFFASPFMALMRNMADKYEKTPLMYPVFGLILGSSNAGKTSFLETLLIMIIEQSPKIPGKNFTKSYIEHQRLTVKSVPIIVDDVVQKKFREHAFELIKSEFGLAENLIDYPAIAISANEDVRVAEKEIVKRTIICRAQASLKPTDIMLKDSFVRRIQKRMGTAFYREYMRRMLDEIQNMIDDLKSEDETETAPDILAVSSKIILNIFQEYSSDKLPNYIREVKFIDYFDEKITGSETINIINNTWKTNEDHFKTDEKMKKLHYNAGTSNDAKNIMKELPADLTANRANEWIIMNLDKAREYFGIDFKKKKKSFLNRFKK